MKEFCLHTWPSQLCSAKRSYLEAFKNFRNMLEHRPKVRFDGIYICKHIYYRKGLSEYSETNPIHEVISYRYIRFCRSGTAISTQTVIPPKKAFPRIRQHLLNKEDTPLIFKTPKEMQQQG